MGEPGEQDYLNPQEVLESCRAQLSDRKLRLFACACGREVYPFLGFDESKHALVVAERYAEGLVTKNELRLTRNRAKLRGRILAGDSGAYLVAVATCYKSAFGAAANSWRRMIESTVRVASASVQLGNSELSTRRIAALVQARCQGITLLHEILRPNLPAGTDVLAWRIPAVLNLALAVYENRQLPSGHLETDRLLILADALEEAGCTEPAVLHHLRSPGPHVLGCWAVDLLLGKT